MLSPALSSLLVVFFTLSSNQLPNCLRAWFPSCIRPSSGFLSGGVSLYCWWTWLPTWVTTQDNIVGEGIQAKTVQHLTSNQCFHTLLLQEHRSHFFFLILLKQGVFQSYLFFDPEACGLISLTRNWTHTPLTTGPLGRFQQGFIDLFIFKSSPFAFWFRSILQVPWTPQMTLKNVSLISRENIQMLFRCSEACLFVVEWHQPGVEEMSLQV